jgi:stage II sporulation protein AA (anti-sigma F factor antagonist)
MDSAGLGLLMGRYRLMRELGGEMAVDRPNERILKILRLSGMERFFEICHAPKGEKR